MNVAQTANNLEIEFGNLALTKATDAEVRSYAQTVIADHRAMNQIADSIARVDTIKSADNHISRQLRAHSDTARGNLNARNGADFDRAYMAQEVEFHHSLLDRIDQELIHKAERPRLTRYFERIRPAYAAHLQRAQEIQNRLSPQPMAQPAPTPANPAPPRPTTTTTTN